jgi:hypothetical protein
VLDTQCHNAGLIDGEQLGQAAVNYSARNRHASVIPRSWDAITKAMIDRDTSTIRLKVNCMRRFRLRLIIQTANEASLAELRPTILPYCA